jgi:hypothetical protein
MKLKLILSILTVGMLVLGPTVYGQDDQAKKGKEQQQQQADRPGEETLTGCLTEQQGSYMFATQSGEQLIVSGSDLAKHKDHTVKLTGKRSDEGGKTKLTVSKIEHVSASCSK